MTGGIWILAEQFSGRVETVSFELLSRALALQAERRLPICALLFAPPGIPDEELRQLIDRGADAVYCVEDPALEHFTTEPFAAAFLRIVAEHRPEILLAGATSTGRTLLPYAAMKLRTGLTADCTRLDIEPGTGLLLQTRPAIGGNIMATIKCADFRPQMATIRPRSTPPAPALPGRRGELIRLAPGNFSARSRVVEFIRSPEATGIQEASRVVVAGRGIKRPETLTMIRQLAELLGAAVGGTREVVDRGWLDYPHQIGLSGRTVTPDLYLGIGVSGAIQHLAGMQTSKVVVAINSDADAPIFQVADFGIRGNLFEVVPALIRELEEGGKPWKK